MEFRQQSFSHLNDIDWGSVIGEGVKAIGATEQARYGAAAAVAKVNADAAQAALLNPYAHLVPGQTPGLSPFAGASSGTSAMTKIIPFALIGIAAILTVVLVSRRRSRR